jgi:hypothetical protein
MMLLASTPGGYAMLRFRGLAFGLLWAWLLPSVAAGAALILQNLFQTQTMGDGALMLWTLSYLVLISPALSWLSLVLAAPLVVALMERGWFGWIPAVALGIVVGGLLAYLTGVDLAVSFGAAQLLILRGALGRACPQAFA